MMHVALTANPSIVEIAARDKARTVNALVTQRAQRNMNQALLHNPCLLHSCPRSFAPRKAPRPQTR